MSSSTHRRAAARVVTATVLVAVLVAGGAAVAIWKPWEHTPAAPMESQTSEAVTVPAELGTLTSRLRLNAALGYGEPMEVPAAPGVITAVPTSGQVVEVGQPVYESDGRPVILLRGTRPFWRDLSADSDDGADVRQLEHNLARLGFFTGEPDDRFDWLTREAVRRWQEELGLPVTGGVAATDVVAVDAPSIRVSQVTGKLGQTGVSPAAYTATTLTAVATLTPAQARELAPQDPVTVLLPDGTELENTIAAVDPGGQPAGEDGQTTPPTAVIEFPDQGQVASTGPASVRVIVQGAEQGEETLIVPATALIATAEDSYAVEVVTGDRIVRVPVEIGLVADARVQILASGPEAGGASSDAPVLEPGDEVVISR